MDCTTQVLTPADTERELDGAFRAKDPFTLVIFGASGDLAKRKLMPALAQLEQSGYLPDRFAIVGFSRSEMSDDAYRAAMSSALEADGVKLSPSSKLLASLHYVAGDNDDAASFARLAATLTALERDCDLPGNRMYYLSVAPEFFATIVKQLADAHMIRMRGDRAWSRVIIEKPFGRDLASARALNAHMTSYLDESQIYRIDHYLGKETVQNIVSFRFGNSIFEPLFNQKYVDNVQITVAETLGMEGRRGAYYDTAGAMRDMVQNHMLQLLCLIAMEPPSSLDAQALRDEKVKVLRSIEPMTRKAVAENTVRGQYGPGERNGQIIHGFRQEAAVSPTSTTESYVAIKVGIDNWRWAGVPFFLRTGKRLAERVSEVAITFKQPPLLLFRNLSNGDALAPQPKSNVLVFRIQPDEGISLWFAGKRPGMRVQLDDVRMDFVYKAFQKRSPEAYERLLLDALRGDAALYTRSDEVDAAWRFISSIHEGWANLPPPRFPNYFPFTDGPEEVSRLFAGTQRAFRPLVGP